MLERTSEVLTGSAHWDNKIAMKAGGTDRPGRGNHSSSAVRLMLSQSLKQECYGLWVAGRTSCLSQSSADWGIKLWSLSLSLWLCSPSVGDVKASKSLPGQAKIYQRDRAAQLRPLQPSREPGSFYSDILLPGENKHLIKAICSGRLYVFIPNNHFWKSYG